MGSNPGYLLKSFLLYKYVFTFQRLLELKRCSIAFKSSNRFLWILKLIQSKVFWDCFAFLQKLLLPWWKLFAFWVLHFSQIFQNVTTKQFTKFFEHQAPFPEIVLHKSIRPRLVLLFPLSHLFYLSGSKKLFHAIWLGVIQ